VIWRTCWGTHWELEKHVKNLMGTHWELEGHIVETLLELRKNEKKFLLRPIGKKKRKKQGTLSARLDLHIGCIGCSRLSGRQPSTMAEWHGKGHKLCQLGIQIREQSLRIILLMYGIGTNFFCTMVDSKPAWSHMRPIRGHFNQLYKLFIF